MILERLSREAYRVTMRRVRPPYTVPDAVQIGPKVCLINKYSALTGICSPGDSVSGLGKLIGTRSAAGTDQAGTGDPPYY